MFGCPQPYVGISTAICWFIAKTVRDEKSKRLQDETNQSPTAWRTCTAVFPSQKSSIYLYYSVSVGLMLEGLSDVPTATRSASGRRRACAAGGRRHGMPAD